MAWVAAADASGDPDLRAALAELTAREPLFHRREVVAGPDDFETETAPDFWETGASGRRYSRHDVLQTLRERWATGDVDEYESDGWHVDDLRIRAVGDDHYLLAYTLRGQGRVTHRLTAWRRAAHGWQAVYHQGTVAPANVCDAG